MILLWLESRESGAQPEWRWHVTSVQTGQRACFPRLTDALVFIGKDGRCVPSSSRCGLPAMVPRVARIGPGPRNLAPVKAARLWNGDSTPVDLSD